MTRQDELKRHAQAIRGCFYDGAEHYYDKNYGRATIADLLLVLEDENYHTEETLVEALVAMDYDKVIEVCRILVEQDKAGCLTEELYKRRQAVDDALKKGESYHD